MALKDVVDAVSQEFGDAISNVDLEGVEPNFEVKAANWSQVAYALRKKHGIDYLACLSSIDRLDGLEAIYNLESMKDPSICFSVRVKCSYEEPTIPTVEDIWRTADWHEREAFDLMGIHFEGHHNLKRILCAEDWEGHPLRKDYESPDYYHGIRNNVV